MSLLLDTHVFLWWLRDDRRLGRRIRRVIADPSARIVVSAASIWEIAIKTAIGKLAWRDAEEATLASCISACGFRELPVTAAHAAAVRDVPPHHGDPFDRLLVAQARAEGLAIATIDPALARYRVEVLDAAQ